MQYTGGSSFTSFNWRWRTSAWLQADVGQKTQYVKTVGLDNFYLPYNVQVRAYNRMGEGPLSPATTVYSAMASKSRSNDAVHRAFKF